MLLLLTAAGFAIVGYAVTAPVASRTGVDAMQVLERTTITAVAAISLWLATTWILALTGALSPLWLGVRALIVITIGLALLVRAYRKRSASLAIPKTTLTVAAIVSIGVVAAFACFKGAVVPPVSHDALAYHLPKAVLFARAEGFRVLNELDPRQRNIPVNYELLLAEIVLLEGRDDFTELPSVAFYLLFVVAGGALAERWMRNRLATLAVAVALAGLPVALLQNAAHKNDLMTAFFAVATIVAASRWLATADARVLLLLMAAVGAGVGTKPQVGVLALALVPLLLVTAFRALKWWQLALLGAFGIAAFLLLGGATYVINFTQEQAVLGRSEGAEMLTYGAWRNLWQAPYVLFAAPFSLSSESLFVPWEAAPWYWRRYELYFSHLGIPFAICLLMLPVGMWRAHALRQSHEVVGVSVAALLAFLATLPVVFQPHGLYAISLPRYALFIVPVVFCWTLAPLVAKVTTRTANALVAALTIALIAYAIDMNRHDVFAPLRFVVKAAGDPDIREIPFDDGRAASVVDRLAGPDDRIAVDAGYASWIQPLFGRELSRPVYFIPHGEGAPVIPSAADWVVIDRSWGVAWEKPGFTDLSQADEALRRGEPRPEELRVRRALAGDPRFRQEYVRLGWNQVVYRRVGPPVQ